MTAETHYTPREIDLVHGRALEEEAARNAPPPDPRRVRYIALLADLAGLLATNPWLPPPNINGDGELHFCLFGEGAREHVASARRLMGGTWKKSVSEDGNYLRFLGTWHGFAVEVSMFRAAVCKKVVTTEVQDVEEVVTPAVVRTVPKPVEVVTWECEPLLAPSEDAAEVTA